MSMAGFLGGCQLLGLAAGQSAGLPVSSPPAAGEEGKAPFWAGFSVCCGTRCNMRRGEVLGEGGEKRRIVLFSCTSQIPRQ